MSMGHEKGVELANNLEMMVYFQYKADNGKIVTAESREFKKYLELKLKNENFLKDKK